MGGFFDFWKENLKESCLNDMGRAGSANPKKKFKGSCKILAFRRSKAEMSQLEKIRQDIVRMAAEVRGMVRPEAENTAYEELYREVLSAFVFGMVAAAGKEKELMPAELHELAAICLHEVFQYCPEEAAQFVRELDLATLATDGGGTAGTVIRRGAEGYPLWRNRDMETLHASLVQLLDYVERRERAEGKPQLKTKTFAPRRHGDAEEQR